MSWEKEKDAKIEEILNCVTSPELKQLQLLALIARLLIQISCDLDDIRKVNV